MNIIIDILLSVYVVNCLFMGLVIMMQRSKQEGLGAAFGGGITESVWGAQTSNVLVKATVWAAALFFILSITLARLYTTESAIIEKGSPVQQLLQAPIAPASTNAMTTPVVPPVAPTATPTTPTPVAPTPANK